MTNDIKLAKLRIDGGTQQRAKIDQEVVADYAEKIDKLPAVVAFFDGAEYWLAGGFHRYHAHAKAGRKTIACDVRKGTQRDAILFSCGDNATHGLKRSNADKRKAIRAMLSDKEWCGKSDRWIAEVCVTSVDLVGDVRRESGVGIDTCDKRLGKDGKKYNGPQKRPGFPQILANGKVECKEPEVNMDSEPEPEVIAKPAKPGKPKVDVRKFDAFEKQIGAAIRANTALKDHCGGQFYHEQIRQHFNGILKSLRDWKKDVL